MYIVWGRVSDIRQKCPWETGDCNFQLCSALFNSLLLPLPPRPLSTCFLFPILPLSLLAFSPILCHLHPVLSLGPTVVGVNPKGIFTEAGFPFPESPAATDGCRFHHSEPTLLSSPRQRAEFENLCSLQRSGKDKSVHMAGEPETWDKLLLFHVPFDLNFPSLRNLFCRYVPTSNPSHFFFFFKKSLLLGASRTAGPYEEVASFGILCSW